MENINLLYFYMGIFSLLIIYHIFIFIGRRNDISNISCAVFNLSIIFVIYFTRINTTLINREIIVPISIAFLGSGIVFVGVTFFKINKTKKILFLNQIIFFLVIIIAIILGFLKSNIFNSFLYGIGGLCFIIYTLILYYEIVRFKQLNSFTNILLFIGIIIFHISLILTALIQVIYPIIVFPFTYTAFAIMAIIFAYSFSRKFNKEHNEVISFNKELQRKNIDFEKSINKHCKEKGLSDSETDIIIRLAKDQFYKEIAMDKNLSKRTIERYANTAFKKLGIENKNQLFPLFTSLLKKNI